MAASLLDMGKSQKKVARVRKKVRQRVRKNSQTILARVRKRVSKIPVPNSRAFPVSQQTRHTTTQCAPSGNCLKLTYDSMIISRTLVAQKSSPESKATLPVVPVTHHWHRPGNCLNLKI